jgi:hypothetical protein
MNSTELAMMYPLRLKGKELEDDDNGRWSRYTRYLDFYKGNQWQSGQPERLGQRQLTVNYARAFIKKGASFLLGTGVRYECADKRAEKALAQVANENGLALLDYEAAIDSAVLGDGAFKVTRQLLDGSPTPSVLVRSVDVFSLSANWAGDDMRRLLSVTEEYTLSAAEVRARYHVEVLQAQVQVCEVWSAETLTVRIANDPRLEQHLPNPYGFIPYVIFPNERRPRLFWGESDMADIMELCSEFNVRMSVMSQILQFSGNPVLVLEGVDATDSRLRVGPGAVWELPPDSQAYLLDLMGKGGLESHMSYIATLHQTLFDLAEMPRAAFSHNSPSGQGASGVSLEMQLYPIIQKVRRKRQIWTEMLERRARLILRMLGFSPELDIKIIWPDILPKDRATLVANEIALVGQGIHSRVTANRNLGEESPQDEVAAALAEMTQWQAIGGNSQTLKVSGALVNSLANAAG